MNGGEIIAQVLQDQGVKFIFTLCGGHISPIFVAAQNIGIRVIDTRHEATTVFAADAVARLSGVPGVAAVTAGPGLTNTITAVKNAYLAQSPVVLLGGAAATLLKGRGSLQDINQMEMMRPNVKWCASIKKVRDIAPIINQAFYEAQSGVPGPVFVECPIDTLFPQELVKEWYGAKSTENKAVSIKDKIVQWYIQRHANKIFEGADAIVFPKKQNKKSDFQISSSDLNKAKELLKNAQKPLLIIGSGAMMQPEKVNELAQAVEQLGIPVYLSGMARGLLGKSHPLQMRHQRKKAIKSSDLILLAGVPNDFRLDYGSHIGNRLFISVNRSKEDLLKNKTPKLAVHQDPMSFLVSLSKIYSLENGSAWRNTLAENDATREKEIIAQAEDTVSFINPIQLFLEMEKKISDQSILIVDGGDFAATASYTLSPRKPLSWLDPGVFGTLGVGAGFALGAKLVFPEKNVFIIYGDGSAGYSLMEYDTFTRHNLPVTAIIGNDAGWTQIARDQVDFLNSNCAVELAYSDYEKIAHAFGALGRKVEDLATFIKTLEEAIEANNSEKSYVINALIGKTNFRKGSISV